MSFGRIDGFNVKDAILIALIFVFVSSAVSIFNSYYYMSRFMESKAQEIGLTFESDGDFSKNAKELLSSRGDVLYVKLVGADGAIRESFGATNGKKASEFTLSTPDKNKIIVGVKELEKDGTTLAALIFSVLIGGASGVCLLMALIISSDQSASVEKLVSAMKRVSRGDVSAKLEAEDFADGNTGMMKIFESFNAMMDQIRRRGGGASEAVHESLEAERLSLGKEPSLGFPEESEDDKSRFAGIENDHESETPAADDGNLRKTVALVAKIVNFDEITSTVESSKLVSFLTEYRKSASAIIADYGGFTETLLQDEIVALFNVPERRDKPELRAICAAVEVLQAFSDISKKRNIAGRHGLAAKVGIDAKPLPSQSEAAIPNGAARVIGSAKELTQVAANWGVVVSPEVYAATSAYVQVREIAGGKATLYSIIGVEEGVIEV